VQAVAALLAVPRDLVILQRPHRQAGEPFGPASTAHQ
jgi:hypothetical protein